MRKSMIVLIIAVLFMAGCGHHASHTHEDDGNVPAAHDAGQPEAESHTLYTEDLELFVEFDPLVAGQNTSFVVHLTLLKQDYSPLDKAEVNLVLEVDSGYTVQVRGAPDIPGIYRFEVTPEIFGEGKIRLNVEKGDFQDQFVLDHVHVCKEVGATHHHGEESSSGQIHYSKEQAWTTEFNVEPALLQDFSAVIDASGEILAMPGEKQNLVAKIDGIVLFATRNLVQGSPVKEGEILFEISGQGFTDNNIAVKYQESKLRFENSKARYLRHKSLVDEKVISESQFLESLNNYMADSVAYFNLKDNVSDQGMKVQAPLTGYIHELKVSEGQFASTGSLLATISSNKVMLLRADVSQQYFYLLDQISDATFRPAYAQKVYTIKELGGKLLSKASSVAENNHYMPVYFEVINDGTLLEGAFAEFYLKTRPRPGILAVPVSALIEEQNIFYVYVQESGESYRKVQVQTGNSDGLYAEVVSGLEPGDRVVTRGAMLIKAASVSSAPVHSHSH